MHSIDVENLMYIFYTCYGISIIGPVLCIISYFLRSKVLYIIAWVVSVLSILASIVFTFDNLGRLSLIIPSFCFFILLLKPGRKSTGNKYLIIYLFRSVMLLMAFYVSIKMIFEGFMEGFIINQFYPIFLMLLFNVVIGFLVYKLPGQNKKIKVRGMFQPVLWSLLIGIGASVIEMKYMIVWPPGFRKHAVSDVRFTMFDMSYHSIFINLACWAITGMLVYFFYNLQQQKLSK